METELKPLAFESLWRPVLFATKEERRKFWSRVEVRGSCWLFDAHKGNIYGKFYFRKNTMGAHRLAKTWASRKTMIFSICCHKCRNQNCVRPSHIEWGSLRKNSWEDRLRDGTISFGRCGELAPNVKLRLYEVRSMLKDFFIQQMTVKQIAEKYERNAGTVGALVLGLTGKQESDKYRCVKLERKGRWKRGKYGDKGIKLNEEKARAVKILLAKKDRTSVKIAEELGVNVNTVRSIKAGTVWAWVEI